MVDVYIYQFIQQTVNMAMLAMRILILIDSDSRWRNRHTYKVLYYGEVTATTSHRRR